MRNQQVINQVIVLFIVMAVGFYARKRRFINKEVNNGLTELLLNITLPFLIVSSFNLKYDNKMILNAQKIFIYSLIIHGALALVSKMFYFKYDKNKQAVLRFITIFSNVGFMGYPVLQSIYGDTGVFYAAIFNIPFNIFTWTIGVLLYTNKKDIKSLKRVIKNPAIIAVTIGLILFVFSIKLPSPIQGTLKLVGGITTPISMIIIGSMLAEVRIKDIFSDKSIYYGAVIRLIVVPAIIYCILKLVNANELLINICVILEAMPAAVLTAIIAEKYGGDAIYASQCVFITTILSVITIPVIIIFIS